MPSNPTVKLLFEEESTAAADDLGESCLRGRHSKKKIGPDGINTKIELIFKQNFRQLEPKKSEWRGWSKTKTGKKIQMRPLLVSFLGGSDVAGWDCHRDFRFHSTLCRLHRSETGNDGLNTYILLDWIKYGSVGWMLVLPLLLTEFGRRENIG